MTKKLLALLVAALMVLAIVPMGAMAKTFTPLGNKANMPKGKVATREQTTVYAFDFETNAFTNGWTSEDADGDGYGWAWDFRAEGDTELHNTPYAGSGVVFSQSYDHDAGPLTPDNYLWSPAFTVPSTLLTYATFWYAAQDASYSDEVFRVYVKANGTTTAISEDIMATGSYQQFAADISAYAGQSVQIGVRHYNCTDMFYLNVDEFEAFNTDEAYEPPVTTPEPVIPPENIVAVYTNSFETQDDLANLAIYDMDQDGNYWGWGSTTNGFDAYDGDYILCSESRLVEDDGNGGYNMTALTPDNWVVEEGYALTVPETGAWVSVWAEGAAASVAAEHFGLVVGSVDAWTNEESEDYIYYVNSANGVEYETTGEFVQYWFDLSDFAGEEVYVAIRHFNCTYQYMLVIDYVQYWVLADEPTPTHNLVIEYIYEDGTTAAPTYTQAYEEGAAYDVASPEIAGYTPSTASVTGTMGTSDVYVRVVYTADVTVNLGDVDCDGDVDFDDVTLLNAYLLNAATLSEQGLANANVNGDGKVSSADVVALNKLILGSN